MNVAEQIRIKRDGGQLAPEAIRKLVSGITTGDIPDYQASALLMAIYFKGLEPEELSTLTDAMLHSGEVLQLPEITRAKIDKHSTGGVGDKISICLAPAVAACGIAVPMISGRGLGHTGGTLDKLEAIPGFRVQLDGDEFRKVLGACGMVMGGQTPRIAPADRKLYALRDVTGTVESIPLIASSIMSKKLAEGIDGLVLDCKVGSGAFMKELPRARELATTIQSIGRAAGKRVTAVLSNMDQPIGRAVGNANEVAETIEVLRDRGPADTRELTVLLGAEMLLLAKAADTREEGRQQIETAIKTGRALDKLRQIIAAQGGDPRVCDEPERLPHAPHTLEVRAASSGTVSAIDTEAIGMAVMDLGGGRQRKEDPVDPAVGVTVCARLGERVEKNQPLALVHYRNDPTKACARIHTAYTIGEHGEAPPLIHEVLRG